MSVVDLESLALVRPAWFGRPCCNRKAAKLQSWRGLRSFSDVAIEGIFEHSRNPSKWKSCPVCIAGVLLELLVPDLWFVQMHSRHLIALQLSSWGMTRQDRIASSAIVIWKASMSGPEPGATSSGGQVCILEGCSRRRFLRERSRPGHVDNYHFSHSISIARY